MIESQHSDDELSLLFQSSSFESIQEELQEATQNIQSYQFEPELADEHSEDDDEIYAQCQC